MRKGQIQLLKRAEKYNLNTEQLELLSREDLPLSFLKKVIIIFERICDYPADKAYEYVSNGKNVYEFPWIPKGDSISYKEYSSLSEDIRQNSYFFSELRCKSIERDDTFYQFIGWCIHKGVDRVEPDILYSLSDLISDKNLRKNLRNRLYSPIKIKRDILAYYMLFSMSLYESFKKSCPDKTREMLKKKISEQIQIWPSSAKKNSETLSVLEDKKSFSQMKYIDFVHIIKKIFPNRIYVNNYIKQDISPEDAAHDVLDRVFDADKLTDVKAFYNLFAKFPDIEHIKYKSEEEKRAIEHVLKNTVLEGSFNISAYKTQLSISDNIYENKPVFIKFSKSSKLVIQEVLDANGEKDRRIFNTYYTTAALIIYSNGTIFLKKGNSSQYKQASVRYIIQLFKEYESEKILKEAIMEIPAVKSSYVFKDLVHDAAITLDEEYNFPPILWNSCLGFKNRNQLMNSLYKDTDGIDFNKMGIPCGYAYMKTRPYIDDKSQGILYNAFTQHTIKGYRGYITKKKDSVARNVVEDYLEEKLIKKLPVPEDRWEVDDVEDYNFTEVVDYVNNTLDAKQKLSLRWNSLAKMVQRNIDMVLEIQNKTTPKITIPKDSVFDMLIKNLPPEFELIKTRERIIREGYVMRHCVASYASKINEDRCAIYHLDYNGHGYTLEFVKNGNKYVANQIQSKANRGAPTELWQYVQELLEKIPAVKKSS